MTNRNDAIAALTNKAVALSSALQIMLQLPPSVLTERDRQWLMTEIGGYESGDDLPQSRSVTVESRGILSIGPYRQEDFRVDGRILPDNIEKWCDLPIRVIEGIAEIEDLLSQATAGENNLAVEWPPSALQLLNYAISQGQVPGIAKNARFVVVRKNIPRGVLIGIIERVRVQAIEALGAPEEVREASAKSSEIADNVSDAKIAVYGGINQFMIDSPNGSQVQWNFEAGNFEGLEGALLSLGLSEHSIHGLREEIDHETDDESRIAKAIAWAKAQASSLPQIAVGTLAQVLLHFFGIG